jgi:hypothetical protein
LFGIRKYRWSPIEPVFGQISEMAEKKNPGQGPNARGCVAWALHTRSKCPGVRCVGASYDHGLIRGACPELWLVMLQQGDNAMFWTLQYPLALGTTFLGTTFLTRQLNKEVGKALFLT